MTDDQLRSIIHTATHDALPLATTKGIQDRARIQVKIADYIIGAIRAHEDGALGYGGLYFHADGDRDA